MTTADVAKIAADAAKKAVLALMKSDKPAPAVKPAAGDDLKAKRLAALEKARAAKKAKAKAKPAKAKKPAAESAKREVKPTEWTVESYTTKRGVKGKLVKVGVWSAFVRPGDEDAAIASINSVFRTAAAAQVAAAIQK